MSYKKLLELFDKYKDQTPERPKRTCRYSVKDYEEHQQKRIAFAERMADNIYKMSNVDRVIDSEAYQAEILDASQEHSSEDNQFILQHAQVYFETKYTESIKKLGESPKLIDQILKRTGKETKDFFEKILKGFNVVELAEKIYYGDLISDSALREIIRNRLNELQPHQLDELAAEFYTLPSREIAFFIKECLTETDPDLASLKILLQTKSIVEIQKIIEIFEENFILVEGQDSISFSLWLEQRYPESILSIIKQIFEPLNFKILAEDINWVINNIDYLWIEFASLQSTIWGLVMNVRHSSPSLGFEYKEILSRPFVLSLIYHLEPEQFDELNETIKEKFGYELTKQLYDLDWHDTATQTFFKIEKSLNSLMSEGRQKPFVTFFQYQHCIASLNPKIHIIPELPFYSQILASLMPLYSLNQQQLAELKTKFKILTNQTIRDLVTQNLSQYFNQELPKYISDLIHLLDKGLQHKHTQVSIYHHLELIEKSHENDEPSKRLIETCNKISEACKSVSIKSNERGRIIIGELQKLRARDLSSIIIYYFKEYEKNFLGKIQALVSPAAFLKIKILISGLGPASHLKMINEDYDWRRLIFCSPVEIAILDNELQVSQNQNLIQCIKQNYNGDPKKLDIALIPAFFPLASQFKQKLLAENNWQRVDTDYILQNFTESREELSALEKAFDILFCAWECGLETCQGPWRNSLLVQVNQEIVQPQDFSDILSLHEEIPIDLIPYIYELAKKSDRNIDIALELNKILRKHRDDLKIVKMLYFVYDGLRSLRERIYEFFVLPRDESLSLLLLDGYDPEKLAREIKDLVSKLQGAELAQKVFDLLNPESSSLIPGKTNWRGEMYHQVRIRYEQYSENSLIRDLANKDVPLKGANGLTLISELLYGDMAKKCLALNKLLQSEDDKSIETSLYKRIANFKPAQIERLAHMYKAYFEKDVTEDLKNKILDKELLEKLTKIINQSYSWEEDKLEKKKQDF